MVGREGGSSRGGGLKKRVAEAAECLWNQIPVADRSDPDRALREMQIAMAWFRVPYGRGSKVPNAAYDVCAERIEAMRAAARPVAGSVKADR